MYYWPQAFKQNETICKKNFGRHHRSHHVEELLEFKQKQALQTSFAHVELFVYYVCKFYLFQHLNVEKKTFRCFCKLKYIDIFFQNYLCFAATNQYFYLLALSLKKLQKSLSTILFTWHQVVSLQARAHSATLATVLQSRQVYSLWPDFWILWQPAHWVSVISLDIQLEIKLRRFKGYNSDNVQM